MILLQAEGVTYTYSTPSEEVHALQGVDLFVHAGEFVCLMGASGSGKSTLLTLLAGIDVPEQGSVDVLGTRLSDLRETERTAFRLENIGIVFQEHNLIEQLSAQENVELLVRSRGLADAGRLASEALSSVGLQDEARRRPGELSGGQRQRVGIARALAGHRPLVLCDEPTGALDQANSRDLFATLRERAAEQGVGIVVATHDALAIDYADTVLTMTDGRLARNTPTRPR